jgi:CheY-like chemotaxis protein
MEALPTILVVDDSEDETLLLLRALEQEGVRNPVRVSKNGTEALKYLVTHSSRLPRLMLLDIKMPEIDGFEVLRRVKSHPIWHQVITVVLTTSALPEDEEAAYVLGADAFRTKPMGNEALRAMIRDLPKQWFQREG